jgi:hypothetical protein
MNEKTVESVFERFPPFFMESAGQGLGEGRSRDHASAQVRDYGCAAAAAP